MTCHIDLLLKIVFIHIENVQDLDVPTSDYKQDSTRDKCRILSHNCVHSCVQCTEKIRSMSWGKGP